MGAKSEPLCFADGIVLFTSRRCKTLKIQVHTLKKYEDTSRQFINGEKCNFMLHYNALNNKRYRIKRLIVFRQKQGPVTYLGSPLFIGMPRIIYFSYLVNKVEGLQVGKPNNLAMVVEQFLQNKFYKLSRFIFCLQ